MATLHLMVGLPCSKKTTLARTLEQTCAALRLTPDEWQLALFGNDVWVRDHERGTFQYGTIILDPVC